MGWMKRLLGKYDRDGRKAAVDATRLADASHTRAQADLDRARQCGIEAAEIVEILREHNAANRYDDWLATVVRR